jgi:hypothetical protein
MPRTTRFRTRHSALALPGLVALALAIPAVQKTTEGTAHAAPTANHKADHLIITEVAYDTIVEASGASAE